jgi:GT2 family glycosyltransferase
MPTWKSRRLKVLMEPALPQPILLTVIVISVAADPLLVKAIESLLRQDMPCEIIVVNSKGGNAGTLLSGYASRIKIIETESRLYAGGARNRGIEAAKTLYVAFLACDCQAAPGWVRERMRLHLGGHPAVASAMLHDRPWHIVAWADQLMLFASRLPHLPKNRVILYGVSFSREIFAKYGLFNENLRSGEDSEFLKRLSAADRPVWAPRVITLHHNNTSLSKFLSEHRERGRRSGIEMRRIYGSKPRDLISYYLRFSWLAIGLATVGLRGPGRILAILSIPIVALGCIAKVRGILSIRHLIPAIDAGELVDME